ncbi:MAG: M23 family metallopeptidase [Ruminococcaceae bacterium]|nr:M23 family metallopeptidase [Oscillospiraceae bacterium]
MNNKNRKPINFKGKGYYIALILCAVAIGISGYLYYRNDAKTDPQLQNPITDVGNQNPDDIQAVATHPTLPEDNGQSSSGDKKPMKTMSPVTGQTVSGYAMDCLSYNATTRDWRVHNGIDVAAESGTSVLAAADGKVYTIYEDDTMGTTVVIHHDEGYVTVYSSLDGELSVAVGDTVNMGQVIGCVGNTALLESAIGDHVHFAVRHNDAPMDPLEFLKLN